LGSFFHRYEWLNAVEYGIGLKAKHIIISKNDNPIGIFPNFIIGIRKTPLHKLISITPGFGGPIVTTNEKEVMELILKTVSKLCRKDIISHQISTLSNSYIRYGQFFEKNGYKSNLSGCRFVVHLSKPYEKIYSNMSSARRRALNKIANKNFDIKVEDISNIDLDKFYISYKEVMKRVDGGMLPFSFFTWLKNEVNERIKIFSANIEGRQVGSILCFLDEEQSSIHYFFSAIEEINFKYYPSELLHDFVIRWGKEHNYETYDFGATGSDFYDSLFKFKEEFGGKVVPIIFWEKFYSKIGWSFFQIGKSIFRKLGKKL
jgi:predicted N-acyltransferase